MSKFIDDVDLWDLAVRDEAKARDCDPEDIVYCGARDCPSEVCTAIRGRYADLAKTMAAAPRQETDESSNPKTLMGNMKVRNLSVIPFTALIHEARAMEYGAFHAPRKDGSKGYGQFNWRETNIEYLTYCEAAIRHIASAADREDIDPDTGDMLVMHLALARATLGILIDAIEHGTVIDNRPKTAHGRVAALLREFRKTS